MGGKEFGAETKRGIAREDIDPTLAYLAKVAKIPKEDLIALGSAGKKDRSGDIDIAVDSRHYSPEEFERIVGRIRASLGKDHSLYRPGFDTHAFAVPIAGDSRNGRVQIDLKYNDASFLRFSHFSAEGERTRYKGAVRSFLLASLAASLYKEGEDVRHIEDGKVVADVRWGLDVNAGLKRIFRMCKMRRDGKGRKKDLENVEPKEIRAEFPDLEFDGRKWTITHPSRIVTRLFGPGVKPKDVETPEAIVRLIDKKHPELVKAGFFERVGRSLERMGLVGPPELGQPSAVTAAPARLDDLSTARLPKVEIEWRELRLEKGKTTKVWAISIEPDGQSFRVREGSLGGKIHEYNPVRPGPKGRPGSPTYTSAEDACRREVERRIQLRLKSGYGEMVDGVLTKPAPTGIDFDQPFPRNVRTPKPEQFISDAELRRLHDAGMARITRKYDGMGLIVVHHTYGWEAYSLQGNRVTDFFPRHMEELAGSDLKPGTVLKAEAVIFGKDNPLREDFSLIANFSPSRRAEEVRRQIEGGEIPEPAFVFYDCLFHAGKELGEATYDQRSGHWRDFPVARAGNGLLLSAERYDDVTPDNWRSVRKELGFEGFVVVDGSSTLGKKAISFGTNPPRPKGSYKLKPNMEEDVVIYAVRQVDGVYESVFTKQRFPDHYPGTDREHPKAGKWFYCGRISIAGTRDVLAKIDELVEAEKITVVGSNKDGERIDIDNDYGVTAVVEFFDRYASNKFRHPKFAKPVRFRDDGGDYKAPSECMAHYLGEVLPKTSAQPDESTSGRGRRWGDDEAAAHA